MSVLIRNENFSRWMKFLKQWIDQFQTKIMLICSMMVYLGEKIVIKLTFHNFYQLWNGSKFILKVEHLRVDCSSCFKTSDSITRNEMRVIFGHFDIDNDGEISFEGNFNYISYINSVFKYYNLYVQCLELIYCYLYISDLDLKSLMISLDEAVTENDIHEMIREADVSNTGAVSFQEFENILSSTTKTLSSMAGRYVRKRTRYVLRFVHNTFLDTLLLIKLENVYRLM